MEFVIPGRVKPYVRMTQKGKWVKPEAKEYLDSKAGIAWSIKSQMVQQGLSPLPEQTPLGAVITFVVPNRMHTCDLDNQVKAVLDAAQGVAFKNDQWIDFVVARRKMGKEHKTILIIEELSDDQQT